jgi:hypothetical protein
MIFDKNHNEVKIGSWVKVLSIDPGFISTFPLNEAKIVKGMINKIFKVVEIAHNKPLIYQQFNPRKGISLALDPEEMELVKTEDPGKVNIAQLPTIH